jgi:alkanesulfonate monooxygenase SsuD/methylene tetrahydromethanopterin reductase-like flavin-dependent oxidoreductase (luciferase family)
MVCLESETQAERRHRQMLDAGCLPSNIVGNPANCAEKLAELAAQYGTNQLLVTTWLGHAEERAGMYNLLAEACKIALVPA